MAALACVAQRRSSPVIVDRDVLSASLSQILEKVGRITQSLIFPNVRPYEDLSNLQSNLKVAGTLLERCLPIFTQGEMCSEALLDEVVSCNLSLELLQGEETAFKEREDFSKMLAGVSKICSYLALTMQNFMDVQNIKPQFTRMLQKFTLPSFAKTFYQKTIDGIEVDSCIQVAGHSNVAFVHTTNKFSYVKKYSRFEDGPSIEAALLCTTASCKSIVETAGVISIESDRVTFCLRAYPKDLYDVVLGETLREVDLLNYGKNILEALMFFHENEVACHDLKLENVYRKKFGQLVFSDFDFAEVFGENGIEGGTPFTIPPEGVKCSVSDKRDMYAFGVLLYQIFTLDAEDYNPSKFENNAVKRRCKILDPDGFWQSVMKRCLNKDPIIRPSAIDLYIEVKRQIKKFNLRRSK